MSLEHPAQDNHNAINDHKVVDHKPVADINHSDSSSPDASHHKTEAADKHVNDSNLVDEKYLVKKQVGNGVKMEDKEKIDDIKKELAKHSPHQKSTPYGKSISVKPVIQTQREIVEEKLREIKRQKQVSDSKPKRGLIGDIFLTLPVYLAKGFFVKTPVRVSKSLWGTLKQIGSGFLGGAKDMGKSIKEAAIESKDSAIGAGKDLIKRK